MLQLDKHHPLIQELIIEHATDEYTQKLEDVRAREARLTSSVAHFTAEFDHLNAQGETLKAAHRSLTMIDKAQTEAERALQGARSIGTPVFDPLLAAAGLPMQVKDTAVDGRPPAAADPASTVTVPAVPVEAPTPAVVSELLNAVDGFVQTQRLAEIVPGKALVDGPQKNPLSVDKVVRRAQRQDAVRRRLKKLADEKAGNSARLPLFGSAVPMQERAPALPPKVKITSVPNVNFHRFSGLLCTPAQGYCSHY
jgi:hypothetical protein